ncbi:NAD-dependent epimerase/dehydratase family protein [Patescibacteria group bacterium]|nr:NAD-dependent epimerase/dehydratase family protein [Patescibacteria group bacterium]
MPAAPFARRNILVTGGAGFIGSQLCETLVKDANVICLDNFSSSTPRNIESLLQHPSFEFINHDITQPLQLDQVSELERFKLSVQGIQEIYHLACPISKAQYEQFRIATILTNSLGLKNILDVAVQYKAKVLYASSSVLYGPRRPDSPLVREEAPCTIDHLTSHGAYDEGKRFSESVLYTYADVYGIDVKISRIFRTYGPRMKIHDGHLLPDMIMSALDGEDIVIRASESARVSLCYVTDLIDGLIRHMGTTMDVTLVNLGSDHDLSWAEVAEKIIRLTGARSRVRFEPPDDKGMTEAPLPDLQRARSLLHWVPLVRVDDGLVKMIDFARSHRQQVGVFHALSD